MIFELFAWSLDKRARDCKCWLIFMLPTWSSASQKKKKQFYKLAFMLINMKHEVLWQKEYFNRIKLASLSVETGTFTQRINKS